MRPRTPLSRGVAWKCLLRLGTNNEYHKKCIESHFKGSENCPVCLVPCRPAGPQTRAKGLILKEVLIQPSSAEKARSSKSKDRERSEASQPHLEGSSSWLHMERRLLTTLSDKLVDLVQSSVAESFRRLAATPVNENDNSEISLLRLHALRKVKIDLTRGI